MRIAILADPLDLQHAGIHQFTHQLIQALSRYDKDNEYIVLRQQEGPLPPNMKQVVVRGQWPFSRVSAWRNFVSLPLALRNLDVDVVFEPAHFGPFYLRKGTKRITMVHDITPLLFPQTHPFSSVLAHRLLLKGVLNRADLVLTNSDHTRNDILKRYPGHETKIQRIYLGRDPYFHPEANVQVLSGHGIRQPYFLNVGTIEPRKNLRTLLKAYELYRHAGGGSQLVITGNTGWKTNKFFEALEQHPFRNDIVLTGFVKKSVLRNLYSSAQAFIYPSLYEGFGIPVVEALACQCPVIVSETSSLIEVGGPAALKFPPMDAGALSVLMLQVSTDIDLRQSLIEKGKEQVRLFDWEIYVKQFQTALQAL